MLPQRAALPHAPLQRRKHAQAQRDHDDHEDRVDYRVRGAFAQGRLSPEDLFRTFLAILAVDGATFEQRLADLTAQSQPTLSATEPVT